MKTREKRSVLPGVKSRFHKKNPIKIKPNQSTSVRSRPSSWWLAAKVFVVFSSSPNSPSKASFLNRRLRIFQHRRNENEISNERESFWSWKTRRRVLLSFGGYTSHRRRQPHHKIPIFATRRLKRRCTKKARIFFGVLMTRDLCWRRKSPISHYFSFFFLAFYVIKTY